MFMLCLKGLVSYGDIETSILLSIREMDWLFYKVLHKSFHLEIPKFLGREGWKTYFIKIKCTVKILERVGWTLICLSNKFCLSLPSYTLVSYKEGKGWQVNLVTLKQKNTAFSLIMTDLPFLVPLVKSGWKVVLEKLEVFVHILKSGTSLCFFIKSIKPSLFSQKNNNGW